MKKYIRDNRKKGWFWTDNELIDLYARHFGVHATAVYLCLCRHANNETQECFPSINMISEKLGISKSSVVRSLFILEKYDLISVLRTKEENGSPLNNVYTLTSKNKWLLPPSTSGALPSTPETLAPLSSLDTTPSVSQTPTLVSPVVHNNTNNNKTKLTILENSTKDLFNLFWEEYPVKKVKVTAKIAWSKIPENLRLKIINDVKKRKAKDEHWLGGYIPNPTRYLKENRWEDDITVKKTNSKMDNSTPYTEGKYSNKKDIVIKNVRKNK